MNSAAKDCSVLLGYGTTANLFAVYMFQIRQSLSCVDLLASELGLNTIRNN